MKNTDKCLTKLYNLNTVFLDLELKNYKFASELEEMLTNHNIIMAFDLLIEI